MPEVIVHSVDLHSATMDEFTIHIAAHPDGKAGVITSPGMLKPLLIMLDHPVRLSLRMPYTPGNQTLRFTITREDPPT